MNNDPLQQGGNDPPARRKIEGTFVAALTFTLRARGLPIGPPETATCISLASIQEDWTADELRPVLQTALVRRPDDAVIFAEVFGRLFNAPPPEPAPQTPEPALRPAPLPPRPPPLTPSPPPRWFKTAQKVVSTLRGYWKVTLPLAAIPIVTIGVERASELMGCCKPASDLIGGDLLLLPALHAALGASIAVAVALGLWCVVVQQRRKVTVPPQLPARKPRLAPVQPVIADSSVFRVGSIGGRPLPFLGRAQAMEVTELFAYRAGEPDTTQIDAPRTILARTRGGDPAAIEFVPRRELPTVLLLLDASSETRHWNTLPAEFAEALTARGVALDRVEFRGSFFRYTPARWLPQPEVELVESAIAAPGWTVTVMFAEAHRLAERDIMLLQRVIENGPVLFLELRDPALWDEHQLEIEDIGAIVRPAAGNMLRDGLAELFAPDRVTGRRFNVPSMLDELDDSIESRLGDALDWASECALVQPVSFALAEQLRALHLKLADSPLAFSRLAALPGTFIGPEGLRFEAKARRLLLAKFSERHVDRRSKVLATIAKAIDAAPARGSTAESVRRYVRAQTRLFDVAPDRALDDILAIIEQGVLDTAPLQDMIGRLRPPGYASQESDDMPSAPEPIRIPAEPFSAAARIAISRETDGYGTANSKVVPAKWSIATPEVRSRLSPADDGSGAERTSLAAAFLPTGDEILYDGGYDTQAQSAVLVLLNTVNATQSRIPIEGPHGVRRIVVAANSRTAAVWIGDRSVHVLHFPEGSEGEGRPNIIPIDLKDLETPPSSGSAAALPLLALDPEGRMLALVESSSLSTVQLYDARQGARQNTLQIEDEVESLALLDAEYGVAGIRNGTLLGLELANRDRSPSVIDSIDGTPTSLTMTLGDESRRPTLVGTDIGHIFVGRDSDRPAPFGADLPDGAITIAATSAIIDLVICVPVEARAAARIEPADDTQSNARETGICVAALFRDGSFDVLGLPFTPGSSGPVSFERLSQAGGFSPMSLLDEPIGPNVDKSHVVAVAKDARQIAVVHRGRLEMRPLIYSLARPIDAVAGDDANPPQTEAATA